MFFLISCEPDPCRDTFCFDGSECVDGICFCLVGQYGFDCSSTYAADVSGEFTVRSICDTDTSFYFSSISTVSGFPSLIRFSHPRNSINDTLRMEGMFNTDAELSIIDSTLNIDGVVTMISGTPEIFNNDSLLLNMTYNGESCEELYYR